MNRKLLLAVGLVCFLYTSFAQTELIGNGGFEAGTLDPWVGSGAGVAVGSNPANAHSGSRYLTMGAFSSANQLVTQDFTVPTNTAAAVLSYFWAVLSDNNATLDQLQVLIVNSNHTALLATVDTESNGSFKGAYFPKTFDLTPFVGQTIQLRFAMLGSVNSQMTTFFIDDVSVLAGTAANVPINNSFANRIALTNASVTTAAANTFASKEPGEPNHADNAGGHSVWWKWTAPAIGTVTIDTGGSTFSTLLGVYTGTTLSNLTEIASDDGFSRRETLTRVKFAVTPGTEYQIAVDGFDGLFGNIVLNVKFTPDTKAPVVTFTSPVNNAKVTNSTLVVKGKATDALGVGLVQFRLENAAGTNDYQPATGTNVWSATVSNLVPGLNTIRVRAFDTSSNVSPAVSRSFKFVVVSPLTLNTSGTGTVLPNLNGQLLEVGKTYTVTAKPGAGFLFSNWTGNAQSSLSRLQFVMQSNMVLQANFIPNPFIPIAGTYQGLFYDTNGVAAQSSGFFSLRLQNTGAFSVKAITRGKSLPLSGKFNISGFYSNGIARPGQSPLALQLQLDLNGNTISGTLSDATGSAELFGNRAVYSTTSPAPQAGKYTVLLPGSETSETAPGGDSFGAVTVSTAGGVSFGGMAADGTKLTQKTFVSAQGQWPLFFSLNKGSSVMIGWLTITNLGTNQIDGLVSWIKTPQVGAKFYAGGFTNETSALGSQYLTNGLPSLNIQTGMVWLANGNLPQSFTNEVVLGANNKAVGTTNATSLTITTSSGLFKGTVPNPATGQVIPVNGVVLQLQNFGGGAFLGTNQVGRVRLEE
jgi:Divergent InlB B-repeat domain/Bacterial Ig domain